MYKKLKTVLASFVLVFVVCGASFAKDFSADFVSKADSVSVKGKIFMANKKMRMENPQAITIARMDKKIVWILMPAQKMYMEQPMNMENTKGVSRKVEGEVERVKIGQETINGVKADKYKITYSTKKGKDSMYQWISSDIEMPVKTAAIDGKWSMELKNIKTGSQPDSLFDMPKGYKKFSYKMPSF